MKIKDIWAFIITPHGWSTQELATLTAMYNSVIDRLLIPQANKQMLRVSTICPTCGTTALQNATEHIARMKAWIRMIQKT